jgi:hypothetical protein
LASLAAWATSRWSSGVVTVSTPCNFCRTDWHVWRHKTCAKKVHQRTFVHTT